MWQIVLVTGLGVGAAPVPPVDPNQPPRVSPKRLIEMFQKNEAFAEERYVDRAIQIRGKVVRITRSKYSNGYCLFLDTEGTGDGPDGRLDLLVVFPLKERKALAALNPGDLVTVQGQCIQRIIWSGDDKKGEKDYSQVQVLGCSLVPKSQRTPTPAPRKP